MISKFELYRITPTTNLGKLFALLPYRDKQNFFEAGKTITWQKMYRFCTENPSDKELNNPKFDRTVYRIFRLLEIRRTGNVFLDLVSSDWYKIENNELVFTERAKLLISNI